MEMNVIQLLSLGQPRRFWVPLLLAVVLPQSVLTCDHPWPNQDCPRQGQAEAHDENGEYLQVETLKKTEHRENEPQQWRKARPGPWNQDPCESRHGPRGGKEQETPSFPRIFHLCSKHLMSSHYVVGADVGTGN